MHDETPSEGPRFADARGRVHPLPLFMPVYQPRQPTFQLARDGDGLTIDGLIVNAFFLYKQRELRKKLTTGGTTLSELVGFDGLISTDSGAFQGFSRALYLKNRDIVRFQDRIRSDIIAPLDLVTPPGDSRTTAQSKLDVTNKRIREALDIVAHGIVAGVQQGGRFLDLRERSTEALLQMGVRYVAIGSLVPFFNKNHDLAFPGAVIRKARAMMGPDLPMHIYGAGDPVELPFFVKMGATVFDSASYGHYAAKSFYMTPYGALSDPGPLIAGDYVCGCRQCAEAGAAAVLADRERLTFHNLWTICNTMVELRRLVRGQHGGLDKYLQEVLAIHSRWFPTSRLRLSWDTVSP
jgi:7-cyano-7-deazaguanine tRNA-ribosyltransferase